MSVKKYKCPRCGKISNLREATRSKNCSRYSGCGSTLSSRHIVE